MSQSAGDTHSAIATFSRLYELQRERDDWVRREVANSNSIFAPLRRYAAASCPDHKPKCERCTALALEWKSGKGDPVMVLAAAELNTNLLGLQAFVHPFRLKAEKGMVKIVKSLPIIDWVTATRGLGELSAAQIIAEAGDLDGYANPAKLWKRFGMAVIDGKRQRRVAGEGAIEQGFVPRRRAIMWNVGACLIRAKGAYYPEYLERKEYLGEAHPDWTPMHRHNDAKRYIEKRLLREMWKAWRD